MHKARRELGKPDVQEIEYGSYCLAVISADNENIANQLRRVEVITSGEWNLREFWEFQEEHNCWEKVTWKIKNKI
jgi:hypothetical protein